MSTQLATPVIETGDDLARCAVCATALPLRTSLPVEQPIQWECARCGARMVGVIDERSSDDVRFNVYPSKVHFTCEHFEDSPERIGAFADQMTQPVCSGIEKRSSKRTNLCLAAAAMPMDARRKTKDVAFMVLVQNVSAGGIAFTHMQPIKEPYVALELWAPGDARLKVLVRVLRTRAVGQFYEHAGEFVTD